MDLIDEDSEEFYYVKLESIDNVDPTGSAVELAFALIGESPEAADWGAGSWHPSGPPWYARALVGVAPFDLVPGVYRPWVRFEDPPETPVLLAPCVLEICAASAPGSGP